MLRAAPVTIGLSMLLGLAVSAGAAEPAETFEYVAYLPEYRFDDFDAARLEGITDLVAFSIEPRKSGELATSRIKPERLAKLQKACADAGTRLSIAVGGWERSDAFPQMAADARSRARFVAALTDYCLKHKLAGADFDWEHPHDAAEEQNYALLITETQRAFRPHKLLLSAALAGWQNLPAEGFSALDRIHLMAYDHDNPRHATLALAESDVTALLARPGVQPGQICLGIPCYGRKTQNRNQVETYAKILQEHRPAPEQDEVSGWYFNGPATVAAKARFAQTQQLRGVMFWELGQDAPGEAALVRAARRATSAKPTP